METAAAEVDAVEKQSPEEEVSRALLRPKDGGDDDAYDLGDLIIFTARGAHRGLSSCTAHAFFIMIALLFLTMATLFFYQTQLVNGIYAGVITHPLYYGVDASGDAGSWTGHDQYFVVGAGMAKLNQTEEFGTTSSGVELNPIFSFYGMTFIGCSCLVLGIHGTRTGSLILWAKNKYFFSVFLGWMPVVVSNFYIVLMLFLGQDVGKFFSNLAVLAGTIMYVTSMSLCLIFGISVMEPISVVIKQLALQPTLQERLKAIAAATERVGLLKGLAADGLTVQDWLRKEGAEEASIDPALTWNDMRAFTWEHFHYRFGPEKGPIIFHAYNELAKVEWQRRTPMYRMDERLSRTQQLDPDEIGPSETALKLLRRMRGGTIMGLLKQRLATEYAVIQLLLFVTVALISSYDPPDSGFYFNIWAILAGLTTSGMVLLHLAGSFGPLQLPDPHWWKRLLAFVLGLVPAVVTAAVRTHWLSLMAIITCCMIMAAVCAGVGPWSIICGAKSEPAEDEIVMFRGKEDIYHDPRIEGCMDLASMPQRRRETFSHTLNAVAFIFRFGLGLGLVIGGYQTDSTIPTNLWKLVTLHFLGAMNLMYPIGYGFDAILYALPNFVRPRVAYNSPAPVALKGVRNLLNALVPAFLGLCLLDNLSQESATQPWTENRSRVAGMGCGAGLFLGWFVHANAMEILEYPEQEPAKPPKPHENSLINLCCPSVVHCCCRNFTQCSCRWKYFQHTFEVIFLVLLNFLIYGITNGLNSTAAALGAGANAVTPTAQPFLARALVFLFAILMYVPLRVSLKYRYTSRKVIAMLQFVMQMAPELSVLYHTFGAAFVIAQYCAPDELPLNLSANWLKIWSFAAFLAVGRLAFKICGRYRVLDRQTFASVKTMHGLVLAFSMAFVKGIISSSDGFNTLLASL